MEVCASLTLRRLAIERDGLFGANPAEHAALAYYANSIAHLVGEATPAPNHDPEPVPALLAARPA